MQKPKDYSDKTRYSHFGFGLKIYLKERVRTDVLAMCIFRFFASVSPAQPHKI